jgi:hypothetical protein
MVILALIFDLIILLGLLIGAVALGEMVLRRVDIAITSPLERILFAAGLGFAIFVYAIVGLAAVGGLYPLIAWILFALGLVAAIFMPPRSFLSFLTFTPFEILLIGLLCVFAFLALLAVLAPPTDWDSLMYHLEIPKRYIQAHGYVYLPNSYSNFPQFVESLYMLAMLLQDDILARLINLSLGGLATLTVYTIARHFVERSAALLAALVFVSSPLVNFVFIEVFIEAGLTFYSLLSILALLEWRAKGDQRWLWLSAGLVGIALAIKYYTIILVLIWAWAFLEQAWWVDQRPKREVIRWAFIVALPMLLFPLPWFIKNLIFVQDPIFPIISGWLGRWGRGLAQANWAFYGMGYQPLDYLLLPWRMTFGDRFGVPKPGLLFLILLPSLIGLPFTSRWVCWLGGVTLVWFIFWANSAGQSVRFFLPGLALLSIVAIVTVYSLPLRATKFRPVFIIIILLGAIYHLIWSVYFASWSLPYITGQQSKTEYLQHKLDIYPVAAYANQNLPPSVWIATVWEERGYYFNHPLVIGQSPDGAFLHQFVSGDDPTVLAEALLSRGLTYLIINSHLTNDLEFNLRDRYVYGVETQTLLVNQPDFQTCFLQPLFEHEGITLYQVLAKSSCSP